MESPAEERVHRRAKQMAVNKLVNKKTVKTMKIVRRANKKAQDNLLHRWSLDKGVNRKIIFHSALHRCKAMRIVRQGRFP